MSEGYEYNLLTQELLLQGYTAEHYPDYVRIGNGRLGKSPLENSCGGFIYTKDYLEKKAFMSGCGLYVSWEKCINDIDYLEETFCFENDNVVFRCPWHKKNCEQNHPLLREDNFGFCACHMVSDYQYEKSAEYLEDQADQKKEELFQKFKEQHKNCICKMHIRYKDVYRRMVEKMVSAEDAVEYFLKRKDRKAKEKQFKRQTNFEPGVPKKVVIMGKEYPSKTSCYDDLKIQKKLVLKRMRDTNCSFEEAVIATYQARIEKEFHFHGEVYKSFVACCKAYGVAQEYIAIKAKREGITRQEAIEKILALREKGTL